MRYMTAQDTLIYNAEIDTIKQWLTQSPCQSVAITSNDQIDMSKSKLLGSHNALNALMAREAAKLLGVDGVTCQEVLEHFEPVPHRLQKVAIKNRITYIDDAIGSNPEATIAGITTIIKEVGPIGCVFLGGQDRDYEYWPLMQLISRLAIPYLVLFPETGKKIKALKPASYNVTIFETDNMQAAVLWASVKCPPDSVCLLSTAAPSYSVWKDFEEKGNLFQEAVRALPDSGTDSTTAIIPE
jgi:UDP-N-acetylmuramoylalanine--D-glutamate ligase